MSELAPLRDELPGSNSNGEQLLPHPYVLMRTPLGHDAKIHVAMAPIVAACWARGILTTQSFQGWDEHGYAYLDFATEHDHRAFLDALDLRGDDADMVFNPAGGLPPELRPWTAAFPPAALPELTRRMCATRWSYADAAAWLQTEYAAVEQAGWCLTMVGSVPRNGRGNDLDVIAWCVADDAADLLAHWDTRWPVLEATTSLGLTKRLYLVESNRLLDVTYIPDDVSPLALCPRCRTAHHHPPDRERANPRTPSASEHTTTTTRAAA